MADMRGASAVATAMSADAAIVFRYVFLSALLFLILSLIALAIMEERPLRTSTMPPPETLPAPNAPPAG